MEKDPFPELKIDCTKFLNELNARSQCSKCHKSRKFFCYTCYLPVPEIMDKVPSLKLPLKVDIIKHPSEVDGKSTAVHAAVIAPDDVTIYTYPCIPDYDREKVCLVFPCDASRTLEQLAGSWNSPEINDTSSQADKSNTESVGHKRPVPDETNSPDSAAATKRPKLGASNVNNTSTTSNECDKTVNITEEETTNSENEKTIIDLQPTDTRKLSRCRLERVVFIDSTWNQTRTICNDERLKGLQCVELKTEKTKFWRHQKDLPDTYLSTVEAIYYFLREFHEHFVNEPYHGNYDNLLFFFTFMYKKIFNLYDGGKNLKAYKDRQKQGTENQ